MVNCKNDLISTVTSRRLWKIFWIKKAIDKHVVYWYVKSYYLEYFIWTFTFPIGFLVEEMAIKSSLPQKELSEKLCVWDSAFGIGIFTGLDFNDNWENVWKVKRIFASFFDWTSTKQFTFVFSHGKKKNKNKNADKKDENADASQSTGAPVSLGAQDLLKIRKAMDGSGNWQTKMWLS